MAKMSPFKRKHHESEEMALQITSMADIFVIILVFLLKSFAAGAVTAAPSAAMLPQAEAGDQSIEAVKVEISEKAIQVDGLPVVVLKEFAFDAGDIQGNGVSTALSKALELQRKRQVQIAQSNTSVKVDARIIVLSDQKTPYSTLKSVLASAATNGFTDFKLAVVRGD